MKQIFALLLLITFSLAPLAANELNIRSYRHKGKLVRLDDSKVTLTIAMGEPVSKDGRQEGPHDRSITVQEWYYEGDTHHRNDRFQNYKNGDHQITNRAGEAGMPMRPSYRREAREARPAACPAP